LRGISIDWSLSPLQVCHKRVTVVREGEQHTQDSNPQHTHAHKPRLELKTQHREYATQTELKSLTQSIKCVEAEFGSLRNVSCKLGVLLHAPRGPFYSPKAARSRWRSIWNAILAFCRVVHRTVRCTTGQLLLMSGSRCTSKSGTADRCSSGSVGAPDTDRCTLDSPVCPTDRWSETRVARRLRGRPLALAPLAHRTVRCTTG
jgi:hypothetical protein